MNLRQNINHYKVLLHQGADLLLLRLRILGLDLNDQATTILKIIAAIVFAGALFSFGMISLLFGLDSALGAEAKIWVFFGIALACLLGIAALALIALTVWAGMGIWEVVPYQNIQYWQVLFTLLLTLLFCLFFSFGIVWLYRRNTKLIDIFRESDYAFDYPAGEIIFQEGDPQKIMYLLIKGQVELVSQGEVLEIVQPGGVFGEMAILEDLPRSATARCITPCKLIAINEKRFYELIQEMPFFAKEMMRIISQRLRAMSRHLHEQHLQAAAQARQATPTE